MVRTKTISVELGLEQTNLKWHSESGLQAKVKASMGNKKPSIPVETVFKRLEAQHARRVKAAKGDA
jgi:hypothetical protein